MKPSGSFPLCFQAALNYETAGPWVRGKHNNSLAATIEDSLWRVFRWWWTWPGFPLASVTKVQNLVPLPLLPSLSSSSPGPESTSLFSVTFKWAHASGFTFVQVTDSCGAAVGHGWRLAGRGRGKHGQGVGPVQHGAQRVWWCWGRGGWRGRGAAFAGPTAGLCIGHLDGLREGQTCHRPIKKTTTRFLHVFSELKRIEMQLNTDTMMGLSGW